MRTGSRTFETAAFLRKAGADTALVHKFFQHDLRDTVTKMQIIQGAQTYRGSMAIALTDRPVGRAIAGQAADEMLNIAGIEASFVLFPEAAPAERDHRQLLRRRDIISYRYPSFFSFPFCKHPHPTRSR